MANPAFELKIALDAASIGRLQAFPKYKSELVKQLRKARDASLSLLQADASDYMDANFKNPSGRMEDPASWVWKRPSPYLGILYNKQPYAQRRNFGFTGMTDSLGRYYESDPGIHWAEVTVAKQQYKIQDLYQTAVDAANQELGRGAP